MTSDFHGSTSARAAAVRQAAREDALPWSASEQSVRTSASRRGLRLAKRDGRGIPAGVSSTYWLVDTDNGVTVYPAGDDLGDSLGGIAAWLANPMWGSRGRPRRR
ncbi:hypothetical protein [Cellulomonas alba]|uniref:Uncharacterized protein n=1 Tax=Cellulomonas alba TaxID=3053467 RepID=A0ABT7SBZ0_9CELL|nr:hypothetical protein [Cellulomonas alba]MDM7853700.1 hypothetical protein [Cellulomonas alba]